MVQVETVAQLGVVFILFSLGLEFSLAKLKVVGPIAVLGGLLQIVVLMFLCGITAVLCGAKLSEGIFVGCFLSMSSTALPSDAASGGHLVNNSTPGMRSSGGSTSAKSNNIDVD